MSELLAQAVRNNAEWCALVCATHGVEGRFGYAAWSCDTAAPRYYPNMVTLRPDCVFAQTQQAGEMPGLGEGWGVKDSFHTLDLAPLGYRAAIQGRWLRYERPKPEGGLDWRVVDTLPDLARWEAAWGGPGHAGQVRIFMPPILEAASTRIFAGYADGRPVAGGILTEAGGVMGLSNIFAVPESAGTAASAIAAAHDLAGGGPIVGWESDAAPDLGEVLGPLQVWLYEGKQGRALP